MSPPDAPLPAPTAAGTSRRRGRALLALVKSLLVVLAGGGALGWLNGWRQEVEARGFATIRTDMAALHAGPGWVDPEWEQELAIALAASEDLPADDRTAIEALVERVASLSFVEAVGQAVVIWPDGLRLELRLREPVACVHLGRHFLGVAADGTVLSGRWPAPPARDSGFLPVIALPAPAAEGPPRPDVVPGIVLDEPPVLDGLAVAVSMWRELSSEDLARIGRCKIDARGARFATVEDPGAVIYLEGQRCIWFGRTPNLDEPGELPVAAKWSHVARALELLEPDPMRDARPAGVDWDLVDVRWDEADLHPRPAPDGDADTEGR